MKLLRLLICAVLALVVVVAATLFLASIFDQEEHAIPVIPLNTE